MSLRVCHCHSIPSGPVRRVLFLVVCTCCQQIVGFSVLDGRESTRTVFEILYSRFDRAPKRIIYDNACNACLTFNLREARFFADTEFVIDRFHWKDHVNGCSPAFNPGNRANTKALKGVNTSVCEQINSHISRLSKQLIFMRPSRFLFFLCQHLSEINNSRTK
jgi:hypothetical protein